MEKAKNAQVGVQNALKELGFKDNERVTDDQFKQAFLYREQQNKVKLDAALLVAKSWQKDEALKSGIGLPDTRPSTTYDFEEEKRKQREAKAAAKRFAKTPDFDPMDVFDRLQDLQPNGDTYAEKFMKDKGKKDAREERKDLKDNDHLNSMKDTAQKFILEQDKDFTGGTSKKSKMAIFDMEQREKLAIVQKYGLATTEFLKAQEDERADYAEELNQKELQMKLSVGAQFVGGMSQLFTALAGKNRAMAIAGRALALGEVAINTALAVSKVWSQTGIYGLLAQAAPIASGIAQAAIIANTKLATGGDMVVRQPTNFQAGEAGPERVRVTPRAKMGEDAGGTTVINIQGDVYDYDKFQRRVKMAQGSNKRSFV